MGWHEDYHEGYERGRDEHSSVEILLTIKYDDVNAVLDDPKREAEISGTVLAPALSPDPLTVTEGRFTLLDPDLTQVETWHMSYRMTLESTAGRRYRFAGHEVMRKHGARHGSADTTTLDASVGGADG